MKNFPETVEYLKRRFYFIDGFLVALFTYIILINLIAGGELSTTWRAIICLSGIAVMFSVWCYIRRMPRFKGNEIGILFAAHSDDDVKEELDRLFNEVANLLNQRSLNKKVRVVKLPPNFIINDQMALKTREKSNCRLLIWGYYEKGNIENQEYGGFAGSLRFTYAIPQIRNLAQNINKEFVQSISNRKWIYNTSNELIERDLVSKNIVDVSRYILGSCLLLFNDLELSKIFFTDIVLNHHGAWQNNANTRQSIANFKNGVRYKLSFIDAELAKRLYSEKIYINEVIHIDQGILDEIYTLTQTSINNYPDIRAYLIQAIVLFLSNKTQKAQSLMTKTRKRWLHNPNPDYSLAFLYAYKGDLRKSKNHYKRAFKLTGVETDIDISHLVRFQDAVLVNEPDHYHLNFSSGLLCLQFLVDLDKQHAIDHFQKFIEIATVKNIEKELPWIAEAQKYIDRINDDNI